jgi:hypothetical protein
MTRYQAYPRKEELQRRAWDFIEPTNAWEARLKNE